MPIRPLAEMTWEEARDAQRKAWIALLPIGAVEAHGPHLPIRTDGIIAEAWAREAAARLQACGMRPVVLPTVDYTSASFAESFPGTLSVGYETVTRLVVEVAGHPVLRRVLAHGGDHDPIGDSSIPTGPGTPPTLWATTCRGRISTNR